MKKKAIEKAGISIEQLDVIEANEAFAVQASAVVKELGLQYTLSVGNGRNDKLMLKETVLGIAILQVEGLCTETLLNSDILVKSIFDVFGFLKDSNRLIATLRN